MRDRIAKHIINNQTNLLEKSTYYLLDAQGNCMNVYEHEVTDTDVLFNLKERHIYGSSSLGIKMDTLNMFTATFSNTVSTVLGRKYFHLSNHLSNNLTTINDIKIPKSTGTTVDYYDVGIVNIYDYSPFGVQLDGRTMESDYVRVSFGGMERDDELKNKGNSYSTEFRQYDPRVGRWLSRDPLFHVFPWQSPYVAFDNNPIYFKDPKGLSSEKGGSGEPEKTWYISSEKGLPKGKTFKDKEGNRHIIKKDDWYEDADGNIYEYLGNKKGWKFIEHINVQEEVDIFPEDNRPNITHNEFVDEDPTEENNEDHKAANEGDNPEQTMYSTKKNYCQDCDDMTLDRRLRLPNNQGYSERIFLNKRFKTGGETSIYDLDTFILDPKLGGKYYQITIGRGDTVTKEFILKNYESKNPRNWGK